MSRVYVATVEGLTPAEYAQVRQMNYRDNGSMQWRLQSARQGKRRGEVALWMDRGIVRSVCLWSDRMAGYNPDGTIDVYTPRRERGKGYGLAVLGVMATRHPEALLFGWSRAHAKQAREGHSEPRRAPKRRPGSLGAGWRVSERP